MGQGEAGKLKLTPSSLLGGRDAKWSRMYRFRGSGHAIGDTSANDSGDAEKEGSGDASVNDSRDEEMRDAEMRSLRSQTRGPSLEVGRGRVGMVRTWVRARRACHFSLLLEL